jgi:hypothetical protein
MIFLRILGRIIGFCGEGNYSKSFTLRSQRYEEHKEDFELINIFDNFTNCVSEAVSEFFFLNI